MSNWVRKKSVNRQEYDIMTGIRRSMKKNCNDAKFLIYLMEQFNSWCDYLEKRTQDAIS